MNTLMRGLGVILLLIGVGILAIPAFTDTRSNTILAVGLVTMLLGFIVHVFLNKKFGQ